MTDEEKLSKLVSTTLDNSETFTEEMMKKIQDELLKASGAAKEYYEQEGGDC